MEHPPPVPVTQPRVQNLAQSEGMRFAGWSGFSERMRWSMLSWPAALEAIAGEWG